MVAIQAELLVVAPSPFFPHVFNPSPPNHAYALTLPITLYVGISFIPHFREAIKTWRNQIHQNIKAKDQSKNEES